MAQLEPLTAATGWLGAPALKPALPGGIRHQSAAGSHPPGSLGVSPMITLLFITFLI